MAFADFFSPVTAFIKSAALKLSMLDGKPGLSAADFEVIAHWVRDQEDVDHLPTGPDKHAVVVDLVKKRMGAKLPAQYAWVVDVIVWAAFHYAKKKGLLNS